MANFKNTFNGEWITKEIDRDCIDYTEKLGKYLCDIDEGKRTGRNALTTSQIRNFFGEIKRIQNAKIEKEKSAFLLIRPKLAYATARVTQRNSRSRITTFREVVEKAYSYVDTQSEELPKHFQNFVDFLESTLAFHKVHGGRD